MALVNLASPNMQWCSNIATIAKATCALACATAFLLTAHESLKDYRRGLTTVLSEMQVNPEGNIPPALTICSTKGFKGFNARYLALKDFLEGTYELNELLYSYGEGYYGFDITEYKNMTTLYTLMRGRCYSYAYPYPLSQLNVINFTLSDNAELLVFAHEPGEEIWFHLAWFPGPTEYVKVERDVFLMDVQVHKETVIQHDDCSRNANMKMYSECTKAQLLSFYEESGKFSKCSVPWMQNLLFGLLDYDDNNTCSHEQADQEMLALNEFIVKAGQFGLNECQKPCTRVRYKLTTQKYSAQDGILHTTGFFVRASGSPSRHVFLFYISDATTKLTETLVISRNAFLGTIGGNLGLFLGMSFLSMASFAVNALKRVWGVKEKSMAHILTSRSLESSICPA